MKVFALKEFDKYGEITIAYIQAESFDQLKLSLKAEAVLDAEIRISDHDFIRSILHSFVVNREALLQNYNIDSSVSLEILDLKDQAQIEAFFQEHFFLREKPDWNDNPNQLEFNEIKEPQVIFKPWELKVIELPLTEL